MLINANDLNGSKISINTKRIIRLRKTYGPVEPKKAVTVDLEGKRIFVSSKLDDLSERIKDYEPLAKLTTPADTTIFVSADRVVDISKPSDINDHPNAKAVISLHVSQNVIVDQQVVETVSKARAIINDALY